MVTLGRATSAGAELGRTEIPQLLDRLRNLRLDELRLTDSIRPSRSNVSTALMRAP